MDATTRELVRRRADNRCEYCLLPQAHGELTHHIEHIVSKQHGTMIDTRRLTLRAELLAHNQL